jgi:hypothetical protein
MILLGDAARLVVEGLRARVANSNESAGSAQRTFPAKAPPGGKPVAREEKTPAFRSLGGASAGGRTSFSGETDKLFGAGKVE